MKETTPQHATETPREESASKRRGRLLQVPVLTAVLFVGAVALSAIAGAALASLFLDRGSEEAGPAEKVEAPGETSAEAGFARDMTVHHAQAVQMAELVRDKTHSEEIKNLAADIALTQQGQIGQMQGWLQVWGLAAVGTEPAMSWMGHSPTEGQMPGMATPEQISELQRASPEEADILFLELMIPHHEAALPMAEALLEQSDREEVEQLATAIAASQEAEIQLMQNLLSRRGVPVEEDPATHSGGPHGDH